MKLRNRPGSAAALSALTTWATVLGILSIAVAAPAQDALEPPDRWPYGPVNAVATSGDLLIFGSGRVVVVADVSEPGHRVQVAELPLPCVVRAIDAVDRDVYVAAGRAGLRVIDIGNPMHPAVVGVAESPSDAWDVAVSGDVAFVADIRTGLRVFDVAVPSHPVEIAVVDRPSAAYAVDASAGRIGATLRIHALLRADDEIRRSRRSMRSRKSGSSCSLTRPTLIQRAIDEGCFRVASATSVDRSL